VILIPEIPYDINKISDSILKRVKDGSNFSIIAVAEGAISKKTDRKVNEYKEQIEKCKSKEELSKLKKQLKKCQGMQLGHSLKLARKIEEMTQLESRVTILGHLQRESTIRCRSPVATRSTVVDYIK
jgi:6-phosphofructokinase 1